MVCRRVAKVGHKDVCECRKFFAGGFRGERPGVVCPVREERDLVARHGAFDLTIEAKGDLDVDQHHTVEDVGIALGEAVAQAIGNKKGILRAGYFLMPMDETLAAAAVDLSGRPYCVVNAKIKA